MFASMSDFAFYSGLFCLAWLAAMASAMCIAHGFSDHGPRGCLISSGIFGALLGALVGFIIAIPPQGAGAPIPLVFLVVAFCSFSGLGAGFAYIAMWAGKHRKAIDQAPAVAHLTLDAFGLLDTDGDGIISKGNLLTAMKTRVWRQEDMIWLKHLLRHWDYVGHEVGSSTTIITTGTMTFPVESKVYAISPEDLQTYPARLREQYRGWL